MSCAEVKVINWIALQEFRFWSGACYLAKHLTDEDYVIIAESITEMYPEGVSETTINDIFWFEGDFIAQILGYEDEEDLLRNRE